MGRRLFLLAMVSLLASLALSTAAYADTGHVTVQLEVEKQIEGEAPSAPEDYVFILEGEEDAPMPDEAALTITGEGKAKFPEITYAEPETYRYTVREVPGDSASCTYDSSVYDVSVMITTDDGGNLSANVSATKEGESAKADKIRFVNRYETTVSTDDGTPLSQTGDMSHMIIAGVLCAAVIVIFVGVIIFRRGAGK